MKTLLNMLKLIVVVLAILYVIGWCTKVLRNRAEYLSVKENTIGVDAYNLKNCHFLTRNDNSKLLFCISPIKGNTAGFFSKDAGVAMVVVESLEPALLAHEFLHSETRYWADKGFKDPYDPVTQEKWAYSIQHLVEQALKLKKDN